MKTCFDGLVHFYPVDIYPENIVSRKGLLTALRRLQALEGFGLTDHQRFGKYSLLHVDVAIYWQLMRVQNSYSALATIRHDLFLCFGFWHAYNYAHVALWTEFRSTFLGDAFWAIFPTQNCFVDPHLCKALLCSPGFGLLSLIFVIILMLKSLNYERLCWILTLT